MGSWVEGEETFSCNSFGLYNLTRLQQSFQVFTASKLRRLYSNL